MIGSDEEAACAYDLSVCEYDQKKLRRSFFTFSAVDKRQR
jgi:hypothetical protein